MKHFYELSELLQKKQSSTASYLEFLRVPTMSSGVYVLPVGSIDPQNPHKEAEMYYVVRGKARMRVGAEDRGVAAGTIIFVEAFIEHRFYDIEEEIVVLVFFAPAETR